MLDVVTIGTATRDVFLKSPFFKTVSDPEHLKKIGFPTGVAECLSLGSKVEVEELVLTTGGGATNTAVTFARQGLKTGAFIKVGDDKSGDDIISDLEKEKVKVITLRENKAQSGYSVILLNPGGERTVLVYRGVANEIKEDEVPLRKLRTRWAYVSPGTMPFGTLKVILSTLKEHNTLLAMNPSKFYLEMGREKLKPILDALNVVVMNREEASYLTGVDYDDERKIFKRLDEIVGGIAVMTEGSKGVMVGDGETLYEAGIFKEEEVVDRTGAGDAFASGFVAALINRGEILKNGKPDPENVKQAVRLGSANATSVVEHIGAKAGILTKEQFEKGENWKELSIGMQSL